MNIVYTKEDGLMNYNTDGFNDRTIYIHNSNDKNRLSGISSSSDNSLAKMRMEENRPNIETVNQDKTIVYEEARGSRDNFILRNNNMANVNSRVNPNNPVANAMNRNMFKKF